MHSISRRQMFTTGGAAAAGLGLAPSLGAGEAFASMAPSRDGIDVKQAIADIPAAVGDGQADDTQAVQGHLNLARITGGGTVWFPKGRYKISSTLVLQSHVHLVGAGAPLGEPNQADPAGSGAVIVAAPGFTGPSLATQENTWNCVVSNLRFVGTAAAADQPVLHFRVGRHIRLERCYILRRGGEGVRWQCGSSELLWNWIANHGAPGRVAVRWPTVDGLMHGNSIAAASHGLDMTGAHNLVTGNFFFNSDEASGIRLAGARNTIVGNRLDENGRSGLLVDGGTGGVTTNVITGNQFHTNGVNASAPIKAGIEVRGNASHNSITGNTFDNFCQSTTICDNQDYGIALFDACHDNAIVANVFYDQNQGGLLDDTTGTNVIVGNAGQA